ncbi:hypothetical protein N7535_001559 [Penicillium sp. DV-2018c]|nr:hypothetical protein N7461_005197 [Penicillium sp. DV-2018c]KAJ5582939.1 hypothetical protein N7535_001559 [Penicillium sp. DV-2018c]
MTQRGPYAILGGLEVGADATEARAANPGSEVLTEEVGYPSFSPESNLVTPLVSGSVAENCMDPLDVWRVEGLSVGTSYENSWSSDEPDLRAGSMGDAR